MSNGKVRIGGPAAAAPPAPGPPADVTLHRQKGLWTLEEVLKLLRDCGLVVELADQVPGGWQAR